jgi:hypothetical protein
MAIENREWREAKDRVMGTVENDMAFFISIFERPVAPPPYTP